LSVHAFNQRDIAGILTIAVFDPSVTTSATRVFFVVYLFHVDEPLVYLSLNQGTTAVREEFRGRAREILRDRADLMRKRIAEFAAILPINKIDLGSEARLPGDYAAGHALGTSYKLDMLPDEARLRFDLQTIIRAYRALTYRGGVDADIEGQSNVADDFPLTRQMSITETRKTALAYSDGARGGRPPFDSVMMFKILVLQATNNLSTFP
jgi:5-methylcytosine-specific restriction protein A